MNFRVTEKGTGRSEIYHSIEGFTEAESHYLLRETPGAHGKFSNIFFPKQSYEVERVKCLFVDMDGVLAVFNNQIESEEVLFQKGYYRSLPPQENVVEAIRLLNSEPDLEVYILSAVLPSEYAFDEKNEWLDEFLPELDDDHRLFVPYGEDKGEYLGRTLGEDDLLLDDYSKNLHEWCPPGSAVKLMNGINGNFGTWQGAKVSAFDEPNKIADLLAAHLGLERRAFKSEPPGAYSTEEIPDPEDDDIEL